MFASPFHSVASLHSFSGWHSLGRRLLLALEVQNMRPNYSGLEGCMLDNSVPLAHLEFYLLHHTTCYYSSYTTSFDPASSSSLRSSITFKLMVYFSSQTVHFISFRCKQTTVWSFTYLIKAVFLLFF